MRFLCHKALPRRLPAGEAGQAGATTFNSINNLLDLHA